MQSQEQELQRMVAFIEEIGIPVEEGALPEPTFLPGVLIDGGRLVVDWARLSHPGDLLHEAGHIAVMEPAQRSVRRGDISKNPGDEIATICWSYAALKHLELDARVVFHPHGYKGSGDWLADTFEQGQYVGLPLLEWMGLTAGEQRARELRVEPYPRMLRWLRA